MIGSRDFAELRAKLQAAAARRRRVRLLDALLLVGGAAAVLGYAHYRIDRAWNLVPAARVVLDVLLVAGVAAALVRWFAPAWRSREDAVDVALRSAGLREAAGADAGDLVAALQFDEWLRSGRAEEYGSVGLLEAVVEQTTLETETYDPASEPAPRPAAWKRYASAAALAALCAAAAFHPAHFAAWSDRALLGDSLYPSRTKIVALSINGAVVDFAGDGRPRVVVAENRQVRWELTAGGELPEAARLMLVDEQGSGAVIELAPATDARRDAATRVYRAEGSAPPAAVVVEPQAGDAFGRPLELIVRPLPRITVSLVVAPPAYAAGAELPEPPPGRLSAAVLEGSRVEVRVECANKPLREAWLVMSGERQALQAGDGTGHSWRLDPTGTALAAVAEPIEFSVEARDDDGFAPAEVLRGSILLRPDQPPTIAAEVVTKYVLPTGKPSIAYQAADDLGVQSLVVLRQVLRGDGSTTDDRVEVPLTAAASRRQLAGRFALELASLELRKGDRVTIRLEARDRNGAPERATAQSEPFTLEVTDEQGLYEAMAETDQRSARKMDEIIQKQLLMTGRGGSTPTGTTVAPLVSPPAPSSTAAPTGTAVPPAAAPSSTSPGSTNPAPAATSPTSPGSQP